MRKVLILAGATFGALVTAPWVLADQEPINLDYTVADSCPSAQEFVTDVKFRTAQANPRGGRDSRQFVVTVSSEADGQFLGKLRIVSTDGASSVPREVTDASCLEVVRTLALVTALAIDPQASTGPSTIGQPAISSSMPPPSGSASVPVPASVSVPPTAGSSRAPWREYRDDADAPASPRAPPPAVQWQWSVGVQTVGLFQVAPIAALGGGLFAEVEPRGSWIIWPDFRLAAAYEKTAGSWTGTTEQGVRARSWWLLVRAEACPGRFDTPRGVLALRFCGFVDTGAFTNTGVDLMRSQTTTKQWLAVGPAIRLTLRLSAAFSTDFEPALVVPITRWSFTYRDTSSSEKTLDRVRSVGASFSWSVGYRFP